MLKSVARNVERNIQHLHGEVWEDLARRSVARLDIDGIEWGPGCRWWGTGSDKKPMEIDIVAESVDGSALLIGEVKLSLGQKPLEQAKGELTRKAQVLPVARRYKKVIEKIFVVEPKLPRSRMMVSGKEVFRVSD